LATSPRVAVGAFEARVIVGMRVGDRNVFNIYATYAERG